MLQQMCKRSGFYACTQLWWFACQWVVHRPRAAAFNAFPLCSSLQRPVCSPSILRVLSGTLVFPRNKYLVLRMGQKEVLCEDVLESMVS